MSDAVARGRRARRALTVVEAAIAISVLGSLLAVAVPTFIRELHASRFAEPEQGLASIATAACVYAGTQPVASAAAFPRSVGLTPSSPPRGHLAVDPPGTWSDPTWMALHFPVAADGFAFDDGEPHAFSFAFESTFADGKSTFAADAHGDLDGDGTLSTFEVRGHGGTSGPATTDPDMYVDAELE
jgi:type II secretory pathway pseudopilin PulG